MGFDIYGRKPRSKAGEHFRSSISRWHPLAAFVREHASIPESDAYEKESLSARREQESKESTMLQASSSLPNGG